MIQISVADNCDYKNLDPQSTFYNPDPDPEHSNVQCTMYIVHTHEAPFLSGRARGEKKTKKYVLSRNLKANIHRIMYILIFFLRLIER